ncbi:KiSS-1 receptor [Strongyloides ratti]|uniref:KiSS-1 receptor n=1 Tax=Strongyloides ratti TaxID=34506 RepID=A0A090L0I4_STRRB|nr:KiSS-1 receptor [Strongyloides ratti]CEF61009.1 KiSS-1 receptor [Strongyloides ratti]
MTLIGAIGNVGVLMVIYIDKKFHEPTNMMIMNLAIADLFFVLICIPPTSLNLTGNYELPEIFCRIQIFFSYFSVFVSAYTLVLLALDRFLAVVIPRCIHYYKTLKNSILACLSTWLLSAAICIIILPTASLYYTNDEAFDNKTMKQCFDNPKIANSTETKKNVLIFYLNFIIFSYILPLTVITFLYTIMLYTLSKQTNKSSRSIINKQWRKKITKTVWLIIATFAICWFPQNIRFFTIAYYYPSVAPFEKNFSNHDYKIIILIFQTMAYANSCINPLLYCLMFKRNRDSLIQFWEFINKYVCCKPAITSNTEMQIESDISSHNGAMVMKKRRYSRPKSNYFLNLEKEKNSQLTTLTFKSRDDIEVETQFV